MKDVVRKQTKDTVLMGVFLAIMMIQTIVPVLGYIPLGFMNATIIHITVIVGAIMLGPKSGAFLGFMFGLSSLIKNTLQPNPTSFVFSPFVTVGDFSGNIKSLIVVFVPRILIGVVAYYVYKAFREREKIGLMFAGICGSMTNTILVLGSIYFLFGREYAMAGKKEYEHLTRIILGIIGTQGVGEAIASAIITLAVVYALKKLD